MKRLTKPLVIGILLSGSAGIGARAYYASRDSHQPNVTTALVTRGAVVDVVATTGSLQAVTTVQVGTQVSGTISWLGADFNSIVRKGQAIARLDPSLFDTQVEQARANRTKASAELDNADVRVADAQQKYARATELAAKDLIARSELEAAKVAVDLAEAQMRSTRAQVVQAEAALNHALLNLSHTVISAPIDGIVIGRNVDVGQTVAASLSSPTVFSIAADLAEMQLAASIDESDIGRIRPAQAVTFRVDAYPNQRFIGTVAQVRLQPTVVQNVTTYNVIIDVPNLELKLKPGMTANVNIEIAAREDVVRVPNAALRFRPTAATFEALGDPGAAAAPGAPVGQTPPDGAKTVQNVGSARLQPDSAAENVRPDRKATTIDALFAPLPTVETEGRVWIYEDNRLTPVPVKLGITDGQTTELIAGDLLPDAVIVTHVTTTADTSTRTATTPAAGLFMPGGGALTGGPGGNRPGGSR